MNSIYLFTLVFLIGCGSGSDSTPSDAIVESNEENIIVENILLDDPMLNEQWSIYKNDEFYRLNDIDSEAHIHAKNTLPILSGKRIKIAVIDDGFDINHPEIKSKIIHTYNAKNGTNVLSSDENTIPHGTAVTGIIAASANSIGIRGIAPNVELILIEMPKTLTDSNTIEMFNKAVELGADIINCSWGTEDVSQAIRNRLDTLTSNTPEGGRDGKGVLIVFAAGNNNSLIGNDESSVEGIISVGATSSANLRAQYSSYGPELDIMAPGGEYLGITTLDLLGAKGYSEDEYIRYNEFIDGEASSFVGTSASAPIISAILAMVLEKNSTLTSVEIKKILKSSVDKISLNIPYINDLVTSNNSMPTFTGTFGSSSNSEFKLEILTSNDIFLGSYEIVFLGNNRWSSTISDPLKEGEYKARLINENIIFATDLSFIINFSSYEEININDSRNDFYGYGKINVDLLIENINSFL